LRRSQAAKTEVIFRFEEREKHFEVRAADFRDRQGNHQA
jgi:hypothetical protein